MSQCSVFPVPNGPDISHDALFDLASYDYPLDESRIAQTPAEPRDSARLMVWNVSNGTAEHKYFRDITNFLRKGDLLVLNDTRVLPARLLGSRPGGGKAEIFLLTSVTQDFNEWRALVRPGRKLRAGTSVRVGDKEILIKEEEPDGARLVMLGAENREEALAFLNSFGHVPLPPYIHGEADKWREEYQTVFARRDGSVAAPTASLHFTPDLLSRIETIGVKTAWVTLHVGLGTFRPVKAADIREHDIHDEPCEVPEETAEAVRECHARGGRVIASGTTVVRTLESLASDDGQKSGVMDTRLFIYPGFKFKTVDALITNFHLPKSSLLMLVAALAAQLGGWKGKEEKALSALLALYEKAASENYRFFSFGDAMFIQ